MRITNNMMVNTLMHDLQSGLARIQKYNQHVLGKKVTRPSDDPVATSKIMKFNTDLSQLEQFSSNISDADSIFKVTESTISEVSDVLKRVKDLTQRAANETFTAQDHMKFHSEIKTIFDQLVTNANFNFLGKYVFSGHETDKPLMNPDGSYAIDVTDSQIYGTPKLNLLVDSGEKMSVSTHGFEIFGIVKDYGVFNNVIGDTSGLGLKSDRLAIVGKLDLNKDINGTMNVKFGAEEFNVNISGMQGSERLEADRNLLIEKIAQTKKDGDPSVRLGDRANIYFDAHDNLVMELRDVPAHLNVEDYKVSSDLYKTSTNFSGSGATTSELAGFFPQRGDAANFTNLGTAQIKVSASGFTPATDAPDDYFINSAQYNPLVKLNGTIREISKEKIIDIVKNAPNAAKTSVLSDRYDVFFDTDDKLVIKLRATDEKAYGNKQISITGFPAGSYNPQLKEGKLTKESVTSFNGFTLNDDFVAKNSKNFENDPIYVEFNGDKKRIVPSGGPINSVDSYVAGLQKSLNAQFGDGKVLVKKAGTAPDHYLTFETKDTKGGVTPSIRIEATRVRQSSLMKDMKDLLSDLEKNNYNGISAFLNKFQGHYDRVLATVAEIGGKARRLEFAEERMKDNKLAFTDMLSKARDADFEESITKLKNAEAVYQAALMSGSKIIQPTLLDFLR